MGSAADLPVAAAAGVKAARTALVAAAAGAAFFRHCPSHCLGAVAAAEKLVPNKRTIRLWFEYKAWSSQSETPSTSTCSKERRRREKNTTVRVGDVEQYIVDDRLLDS